MKILLLSHDGKLGDAIVNSAFIYGAKKIDPKLEVQIVTSGYALQYWEDLAVASKIWKYDHPGFLDVIKILIAIRKEHFDFVITFKRYFKSEKTRLLIRAAASKNKIISGEDENHETPKHITYKSLRALAQIYGDAAQGIELKYLIKKPSTSGLTRNVKKICLIKFFGADNDIDRTINSAEAIDMVNSFSKKIPTIQLRLICTNDSLPLLQKIQNKLPPECEILNTNNNFPYLVQLCNDSNITVTVDTSIVHIASALNKPCIVIYKNDGWHSGAWAPLSDFNDFVLSNNPTSVHGFSTIELTEKVIKLMSRV